MEFTQPLYLSIMVRVAGLVLPKLRTLQMAVSALFRHYQRDLTNTCNRKILMVHSSVIKYMPYMYHGTLKHLPPHPTQPYRQKGLVYV